MHLSNHSPSKCTIAHNPELLTLFSGMETMNNLTLDTRQAVWGWSSVLGCSGSNAEHVYCKQYSIMGRVWETTMRGIRMYAYI